MCRRRRAGTAGSPRPADIWRRPREVRKSSRAIDLWDVTCISTQQDSAAADAEVALGGVLSRTPEISIRGRLCTLAKRLRTGASAVRRKKSRLIVFARPMRSTLTVSVIKIVAR